MRWLGKEKLRFLRGQRGFTLIEVLVAVGILGFIGAGLAMALDTNYRATRTLDEQVVAGNLATAYFEAINDIEYTNDIEVYKGVWLNITTPPQYDVLPDLTYSGDGTAWVDDPSDKTLQKITLFISHGGKPVLSICTYRTKE